MPRIRSIKPGFCTSEDIAALTIPCRLHFAMLWTYADDAGRGIDNPRLIKAALWPLDDNIGVDQIETWQAELAHHGRIIRYTDDAGRRLFQVDNFTVHQKPNRTVPSALPPPAVSEQCTSSAQALPEQCTEPVDMAHQPPAPPSTSRNATHCSSTAQALHEHGGLTPVVGGGEEKEKERRGPSSHQQQPRDLNGSRLDDQGPTLLVADVDPEATGLCPTCDCPRNALGTYTDPNGRDIVCAHQ